MAPQHLGQDVKCSLSLAEVNACGVTVRRDLLNGLMIGSGAALAHAAQDEAEQLPHVAAAIVRVVGLACLIALRERGHRFVDHPVLRAGENCRYVHEPPPPFLRRGAPYLSLRRPTRTGKAITRQT